MMAALFEEINDTLQEVGQMMVVADLSKDFSLPHDFLMQVINRTDKNKAIFLRGKR